MPIPNPAENSGPIPSSEGQPGHRLLVTGAGGYVASRILPTLRSRYRLRLVDINGESRGITSDGPFDQQTVFKTDLAGGDPDQNRWAFRGVDTVVHVAYHRPPDRSTPRGYFEERVNVDMAYNVYQLALEEGVRRVVVASSNHAAGWYEELVHAGHKDVVLPTEDPLPDSFYGWAKIAIEHMGHLYAQGRTGRKLEVVQVRIGAPRELSDRSYAGEEVHLKRDLGAYISARDLGQLFSCAVDAASIEDEYGVPFIVVYGISANTRAYWSLVNARRLLGYNPVDDSELRFPDLVREVLAGSPGKVGSLAGESRHPA